MESSRVNSNGERDGCPTTGENPVAYRRVASQSQLSQPQPDDYIALDEQLFRFPTGVDFQTLESSFDRLSVRDSTVRQQNPSLWTNGSSSSLQNQGINGGGGDVAGGGYRSQREIDLQPVMNQRTSSQNDYFNGGQSSVMLNNGCFLNGNSQDVPYLSRDRHWDSNNGFGSWMRGNKGFVNKSLGSIALLAKDRNASLLLQKRIEGGSRETIDVIFNEVIFHIRELMVDLFGCHVVQKLMEKCSSEQITQIIDLITQHQFRFDTICVDQFGSRSIQSLLRCLYSEEQILRLVGAVSMGAVAFTRCKNAKHVIMQCFTQFQPSHSRNLLEVIAQNCFRIAIDQLGCCMLQECLVLGCQVVTQRLIHEIIANALRLCLNCYGNYLVQYVVELKVPNVTLLLVQQLLGNYSYLSRDKYGSHVVEKFLKIQYIDPSMIVYDLLTDIDTLLLDQSGNYVIQTAWFVCKGDLRISLMRHIERNKQLMRCNKYGSKILEKLNL